jgi:pyruvate dehydrogenase E2 component (dihydrolipoamide acetyltransferase)
MTIEVKVPDIGDFKDIPVIEVMVKPGDTVKPEDALITLESDKATMDVPSPAAGVVEEVLLKVGDAVSMGTPVAKISVLNFAAVSACQGSLVSSNAIQASAAITSDQRYE